MCLYSASLEATEHITILRSIGSESLDQRRTFKALKSPVAVSVTLESNYLALKNPVI